VNPETPPENWINYTDPDHDANVEWSVLVWTFVAAFCITIIVGVAAIALKVGLTIMVPWS
jgi:hypothetical protein